MAKGLQLLLAGVLLGLMGVFSVIGVKSILDDKKAANQPQQPELVQQTQQVGTTPQTDTSMTMADQAVQQPSTGTQVTPAQTQNDTNNQQDSGQTTQSSNDTTDAGNVSSAEQENTQQQQTTSEQETQAAAQPTQSTEEENKLDMQLIDEYGGLQLTLSDPASPGQPARGQFIIRDAQDQVIADMKDTDTASFDLSPGIYEITVIAKGKKSARMVKIVTGEFVTEHFELPGGQTGQNTQQAQNQGTQQQGSQDNQQQNQQGAANNTAQTQSQNDQQQNQTKPGFGRLSVLVQAAGSNAPLKSNIYVQLPNGKHVTKKNYADSANFELRPGTYKVTVKAQGKVDIVRNIGIQANGNVQQVFSMQSPAAQAPQKPELPPEGTLSMQLKAPAGQNARGRFVIQDAQGKRVTRMRGVSNADIKLKPGRYTVVAVHKGARLAKPVDIFKDKTSRVAFNINEFPRQNPAQQNPNNQQTQQQQQVQVPAQQGILQLIAVSGVTRQPLKVNFMVSTLNGKRLKTANNVSVTELALPPQDVLVDIAYEEMRGQERIKVKAGEPTVFTFTVTPNNQAAPINQVQQQAPKSLEEMLMERLQQEILQRLNTN